MIALLPTNYTFQVDAYMIPFLASFSLQGKPGPGAYKVKRELVEEDKPSSSKQSQALAAAHPPFLTQSKVTEVFAST